METKGQPTQQDKSKQIALKEWVEAVNQDGRFGKWTYAVSNHPKDIERIIERARAIREDEACLNFSQFHLNL